MAAETDRDRDDAPMTNDPEDRAPSASGDQPSRAPAASPAAPKPGPIETAGQEAAGARTAQNAPAEATPADKTAAEKLSPEAKAAAAEKAKAAAAAKAKAAAAVKPKADEGPPRALPSQEDIAAWARGGDANVGILFEGLPLNRFDVHVTKIRNEELVPQHWQVISALRPPEDGEFDRLPEIGRLRQHYRDQTLSRRRLDALKVAWRELRGKRPSLWAVPDLLAAMRRIVAKQHPIDWNDLLSAARDLWLTSSLPAGRNQVEMLWSCLSLVREGTKK
jgi:hypothetical protein